MLSVNEKIERRGLRSELKELLDRSKSYLLSSLSTIEFKAKIAKTEEAELGEFIKEL